MKKIVTILMVLTTAMTVSGCMKVIKIGEERKYTGKSQFSASASVSDMWDNAVLDITSRAIDLPAFLQEANGDLQSLATQYGKFSMGTSGTISYPVKGSGIVTEVENTKKAGYMTVTLEGYDGSETIKLQIGSVYKGSSTRDNLTFIAFGNYTNQEEWGAISKQLHAAIDEKVIQPADPVSLLGKKVEFVGTFTAEKNDELLITPISLMVK